MKDCPKGGTRFELAQPVVVEREPAEHELAFEVIGGLRVSRSLERSRHSRLRELSVNRLLDEVVQQRDECRRGQHGVAELSVHLLPYR